jgi:pyruvate/2-oxoglutarate dehydrogenase complex dihydrolipoamide acyltransferase (E2) component
MALEFRFPDVGEGIHEGVIVQWLVKGGEAVAVDQPFVKVETDKAVVDLPAPRAGVLLAQHFQKGATIHVGDVIATFGDPGEKVPAASASKKAPAETAPRAATVPQIPLPAAAAGNGKVLATPHTRALARKLGVDLRIVNATGKNGRITDADVQRAASGAAATQVAAGIPAQPVPAAPGGKVEITEAGPVERTPVTHLRKVIAQAMALSKHTSAHVTHVDEADVTGLVALYRQVKPKVEADGVTKFSLMPLFLKAAALTLKAHPIFNASYDEGKGEIVLKRYVHLGVAVDTPEGLIVPVVRDVDKKDMVTLARELQDLAARARQRRLSLEELKGGSFTVTNIGAIGGVAATPIIHQPELAILALFAIKERPAVVDGLVVPRKLMNVAVTFDHRIIDGAQGARFTRDLIQLLENPGLLMVRL